MKETSMRDFNWGRWAAFGLMLAAPMLEGDE